MALHLSGQSGHVVLHRLIATNLRAPICAVIDAIPGVTPRVSALADMVGAFKMVRLLAPMWPQHLPVEEESARHVLLRRPLPPTAMVRTISMGRCYFKWDDHLFASPFIPDNELFMALASTV